MKPIFKSVKKAIAFGAIALMSTHSFTSYAATVAEGNPPTINSSKVDAVFLDGDGKKVSLSSLQGKVVFVNFWATWCPPCIKEMPSIQALKDKFAKKDVVFMMVDVDSQYAKSKAFMDKKRYTVPVYIPGGNISEHYLGTSVPTTIIFDKKGNLVQRIVGGVDYDSPEVEKFMNQVLAL
ncbi:MULTISPECIES: TlpA family protein disulfide reductase [unclassified Myroides]|uniref:TlpA family protein disulfide reductase n=1 Tax=unclassified Myroides TaxID=2642485 RepID=UPI00310167B5